MGLLTSWYDSAVSAASGAIGAAQSTVSGLWTNTNRVVSGKDQSSPLGLFEPSNRLEEIDWDYSEPYSDNTAGNRGCPVGYYTYYTPDGPVCRRYGYTAGGRLTGYDAGSAASDARSIVGSLTETLGSVTHALAAPVRQAQTWFAAVPWFKGSYVIIALLLAVAVALFMGTRFLNKAEGR